ncbi:MAG: heme exporter protein B [Cognaticolwellia sp.]|jgi:heme exporter protein B
MNVMSEIWFLLKKDITLELRQKYAISGIILYVFSTVFVVYLAFIQLEPRVWNTLFWIIILFASVNAVNKSFTQESGYRALYYYSIANPIAVIVSKMIYNTLLLSFLTLLTFGFLSLIAGNPVKDLQLFITTIFLGSVSLAITLTFISSIAVKANNSATLMAVLSFPIVIPILITLIKLSAVSLRLIQDTSYGQDIVSLLAIDLILISVAFILFPFVWKD